ncbi:leucine-rich_repeat domain-containing protein [Hexamita inflata]|uniref:Leucine-rich repeat domain-containing protein n=1 Tax=Hexamita inflata TaxID=28002 RepID=A0AA86PKK8_9EUKA|nr:leucine-rich repeat domain-containing protein [Hexamita inflata]CAI9940966.1 leucine-rich repeat domain-containing protein [Hexamita inflata]
MQVRYVHPESEGINAKLIPLNVTELIIRNLNIENLSELKQYANLKKVDASFNPKIRDVTGLIGIQLDTLILNGCDISNLSQIRGLNDLSVQNLKLSCNFLKQVSSLSLNLQSLDLTHNLIQEDQLPYLRQLKSVKLFGNDDLENFLDASGSLIILQPVQAPQTLSLSKQSLTNESFASLLSANISLYHNLSSLDISFNPSLRDMSPLQSLSLKHLSFTNSKIQCVSDLISVNKLPLTVLNLSENEICSIFGVKELNVQLLILNGNQISESDLELLKTCGVKTKAENQKNQRLTLKNSEKFNKLKQQVTLKTIRPDLKRAIQQIMSPQKDKFYALGVKINQVKEKRPEFLKELKNSLGTSSTLSADQLEDYFEESYEIVEDMFKSQTQQNQHLKSSSVQYLPLQETISEPVEEVKLDQIDEIQTRHTTQVKPLVHAIIRNGSNAAKNISSEIQAQEMVEELIQSYEAQVDTSSNEHVLHVMNQIEPEKPKQRKNKMRNNKSDSLPDTVPINGFHEPAVIEFNEEIQPPKESKKKHKQLKTSQQTETKAEIPTPTIKLEFDEIIQMKKEEEPKEEIKEIKEVKENKQEDLTNYDLLTEREIFLLEEQKLKEKETKEPKTAIQLTNIVFEEPKNIVIEENIEVPEPKMKQSKRNNKKEPKKASGIDVIFEEEIDIKFEGKKSMKQSKGKK